MRHRWTWFALICLFMVSISGLLRPSLAGIAEGRTFIYGWHVDVMARPLWAIIGFAGVALWFFLHRVFKPLQAIGMGAILLLALAGFIYTLVIPVLNIGQIAYHVQTVHTEAHVYRVFYQYEGITQADCDYVLVACDSLGVACRQIARADSGGYCMGQYAPILLEADGEALRFVVGNEEFLISP